jgi:hypothetical protein
MAPHDRGGMDEGFSGSHIGSVGLSNRFMEFGNDHHPIVEGKRNHLREG